MGQLCQDFTPPSHHPVNENQKKIMGFVHVKEQVTILKTNSLKNHLHTVLDNSLQMLGSKFMIPVVRKCLFYYNCLRTSRLFDVFLALDKCRLTVNLT